MTVENGIKPDQKDLMPRRVMKRAGALAAIANYMLTVDQGTRGTLPSLSMPAVAEAFETGDDPNGEATRCVRALAAWFARDVGLEVREKEQKD